MSPPRVDPDIALGAFAIALPVVWTGAMGAVVVTVLDAPTPPSPTTLLGQPRDSESSLVPPEFAGFSTAVKMLIPVVVSAVGTVPVYVARFSDDSADISRVDPRRHAVHRARGPLGSATRPLGRQSPGILRRGTCSNIMNTPAGSRSNRPQSTSKRARTTAKQSAPAKTTAKGTTKGEAGSAATKKATKPSPRPVPTGPPAAIDVQGLTKTYGDAPALRPLDLRVETGERISLIGHNGSGKTTLMRMLVGMFEPTDGTATIVGHPIGSIESRASISFLADQPVFYDDLTVWEHLEYIARLHGTEDWEQQAVDLVDMVGLMPRVDDLPTTFSRGLKQKAAITMAFVRPFDVMLIDEPFVGLDRTGREALLELLTLAHGDGATLVVATHELSSVKESSRLIALSDGGVTFDGLPADADLATRDRGQPPDLDLTALVGDRSSDGVLEECHFKQSIKLRQAVV